MQIFNSNCRNSCSFLVDKRKKYLNKITIKTALKINQHFLCDNLFILDVFSLSLSLSSMRSFIHGILSRCLNNRISDHTHAHKTVCSMFFHTHFSIHAIVFVKPTSIFDPHKYYLEICEKVFKTIYNLSPFFFLHNFSLSLSRNIHITFSVDIQMCTEFSDFKYQNIQTKSNQN